MPRFFMDGPLQAEQTLALPASAARHVQVLRLQPGQEITLFNGLGGQWSARIVQMGRSQVQVRLLQWQALERQAGRRVHLAVGMPANERMDWLVEKATELGAASLWPLQTAHSVLRLSGERAEKKRLHWQAVARAACEQCGANRLPEIGAIQTLSAWLAQTVPQPQSDGMRPLHPATALHPSEPTRATRTLRCVLSLDPGAALLADVLAGRAAQDELLFLSGPEGGLSADEEAGARAVGFVAVSLGPRVLRAETAALTALARAT